MSIMMSLLLFLKCQSINGGSSPFGVEAPTYEGKQKLLLITYMYCFLHYSSYLCTGQVTFPEENICEYSTQKVLLFILFIKFYSMNWFRSTLSKLLLSGWVYYSTLGTLYKFYISENFYSMNLLNNVTLWKGVILCILFCEWVLFFIFYWVDACHSYILGPTLWNLCALLTLRFHSPHQCYAEFIKIASIKEVKNTSLLQSIRNSDCG